MAELMKPLINATENSFNSFERKTALSKGVWQQVPEPQ